MEDKKENFCNLMHCPFKSICFLNEFNQCQIKESKSHLLQFGTKRTPCRYLDLNGTIKNGVDKNTHLTIISALLKHKKAIEEKEILLDE